MIQNLVTKEQLDNTVTQLNSDITKLKKTNTFISTEQEVGTWFGAKLYCKCYSSDTSYSGGVIDANLKLSSVNLIKAEGAWLFNNNTWYPLPYQYSNTAVVDINITANGLTLATAYTLNKYRLIVYYTK